MHKEQIIIDGVDVKDCRRRIGKNSYCRYFKRLCSDNNVNCVWKQLARKTQECEIWKNQVLILDEEDVTVQVTQEQFEEYKQLKQELYFARNEVHSKTEYIREQRDIIDKLKQEYEQLQEKYEALKLENQEGYEIVAELKQERKELKNELDLYKTWYRAKHDDVKNLLGRYRKALDDIEKYLEDEEWSMLDFTIRDIKDIINKAKGEENE